MRYSLLASAALATTLLATGASFAPAQAAQNAMLQPVTKWAITKVDASGKQAGYCALARRFKQNTILTMARNPAGETSLALDFQAPKLKTGENTKITLDPGAGEQRSYYISPITAQAFVVRLGRDDKFIDALQTTGFLRVEADGQSYNFNLADIDTGNSNLEGCIANIGGVGMQQADADNEIETLRRDVQGLKKENQRLASIVQDVPPGDVVMPDEVVAERLSGHARTLEQENDTLRLRHEARAQVPSRSGLAAGQVYSDEVEVGNLARENAKLSKMLSGLTMRASDGDGIRKHIESLQQENRAMRADMVERSGEGSWGRSHAQIADLKEENRRLQKAMNRKPADLVVAQLEPAAGDEPPIKNILEEVEDEPPAMPQAAATVDELMAQIKEKDAKLVEMSSLQSEIEDLREKNKELEQKLLDSVQDKETIKALNEKIAGLEAENAKLAQQLKDGGGASDEQVKALTAENESFRKQIEELKDNTQETDALRQRLADVQKENDELKAKAPEAASAAATPEQAAQIESLTKDNEELRQKLAAADTHIAELETQLKAAQESKSAEAAAPANDEDLAKLKSDLEEQSKHAAELEQQLSAAKAEAGKAAAEKVPADDGAAAAEAQALQIKLDEQTKRAETAEAELKTAKELPAAETTAPSDEEIKKQVEAAKLEIQKQAEEEKQIEMASLANENMALKKMLVALTEQAPVADAPVTEVPVEEVKGAEAPPMETKEVAVPVTPPKASEEPPSNIVAADYPPELPKVEEGMTEAQKQEAAMMDSMKDAPKAEAPAKQEDISWSDKKEEAPAVADAAPAAEMPVEAPAEMPAASAAAFSVTDIVASAQIASPADVQKVERASGPDRQAYQWKVGQIFGSAEQRPMQDASKFDEQVKAYLEKTHKRCAGDFAASPDKSSDNASGRIDTYEIACVGKAVNSTASLAFVNKAGYFTVFAHETSADQMGDAMELRDRLVKALAN